MSKHILVVTQYFFPENFRINDICLEWIKRGYKITVITGIPNYPTGKFFKGYGFFRKRKENYKGINVIRIPIIPRGKISITLAINYLSFVISGFVWKTFTKIKADMVFNFEVSPMTQALPAIWYSKRRKIPVFVYIQDLWPDNVQVVGGIQNRKILKYLELMTNSIYRNSTKLLVTSESFKNTLLSRGVSENKVIYWPQYAENHSISKQIENYYENYFKIMFTGNIGDAQGLEILSEVAVLLSKGGYLDKIKFILIGDGRNRVKLEERIDSLSIGKMFIFEGQKPSIEIPSYLAKADVAFLSFADNDLFRMTIPSKLQTYLACGKPILAVAKGETKRIIEEADNGYCSNPGDVETLYQNIIKFIELKDEVLSKFSINSIIYSDNYFRVYILNLEIK
jgi:glycosyltransferase involved in cell wall biosynthesis